MKLVHGAVALLKIFHRFDVALRSAVLINFEENDSLIIRHFDHATFSASQVAFRLTANPTRFACNAALRNAGGICDEVIQSSARR
jgi:hypothetical protein